MKLYFFLLTLALLGLCVVARPTLAQSSGLSSPLAPAPTSPPAIMVLHPTSTPAPTPQGSLLRQVWEENQKEIVLVAITTIIASILIGVWLRQIATALADGVSRLLHFLFDRFASAPLLNRRYDKTYRQTLARAVQTLASSNIVDREMRLDQVYVPVKLTEDVQPDARTAFEDLIQWDQDRRRQQRERAVEPWAAIRRFPRLVVMGEPGAGKTTYLSHLAFLCARRERLATHTPIFAPLRGLVGAERLEEALPQLLADHNFPHAERFIRRRLESGRCLLLLDGLDEVGTPAQHERLIDLVQDFADRWVRESGDGKPGNIVVVSTRTYSYQHSAQLLGFTKTEVMDFDDPTIERFVHNWFDPPRLRPLAPKLLDTLGKNRRFKELARNPLLLLLIVDHYEQERWLPRGRADLYDRCVETRIARWNERRGTHRGRFGKTDKRRMLRELALHLYQTGQQGLLEEDQLFDWLKAFIADSNIQAQGETPFRPQDFLDEVIEDSGLVRERALRRYGFSHLTLQEYFAARGADRLGAEQGAALLEPHLADPRWHEVILLYCGLADDAALLLEKAMLRAQRGDEMTWLLAGRCLDEGARRVEAATRRAVSDGLLDLVRRAEAGHETALTADERNEVLRLLPQVAPEALPGHVRALLDTGAPHDALLAARLLPAEPDPALQEEINQRLKSLARDGAAGARRAAAVALGWTADADADTVATLGAGLEGDDPAARAESARALGRLGADDEATLAALLRLYPDDPADAARHAALQALLALGQAERLGMCLVPAGRFLMGSPDDDPGAGDNERPQHELYLPDFYLDRTLVTNAQYRRFVAAGGYARADYWAEAQAAGRWKDGVFIEYKDRRYTQPRYWDDPKWNGDRQPVVGVSWYEALAYARWAGKRLPTEAEWEKAASWSPPPGGGTEGGCKLRYPWGDEWQAGRANTSEAGHNQTTPVDAYPDGASPCGALDMAGNVWEWTASLYAPYPYRPDDGRNDLDADGRRVLRGGSWFSGHGGARGAVRVRVAPGGWDYVVGFRVVVSLALVSSDS
jgi:formylglycine-generating enzyme required for sulfatase activity